jgi:hypothetical protein
VFVTWRPPASAAAALRRAAGIESITASESVTALKTALNQGTTHAIKSLGVTDGFLKNPKVKIPLPPTLQKAESTMRLLGMGDDADALVVTMNRAAEAAVPEAKTLLVTAVKQMSLSDARQILTGGDDAATQYFRKVSYDKLEQKFLPIVKAADDQVALSQQYNQFVGQAAQYGLVDSKDANVEGYVTRQGARRSVRDDCREERAIRKDPLGQSSQILEKGVWLDQALAGNRPPCCTPESRAWQPRAAPRCWRSSPGRFRPPGCQRTSRRSCAIVTARTRAISPARSASTATAPWKRSSTSSARRPAAPAAARHSSSRHGTAHHVLVSTISPTHPPIGAATSGSAGWRNVVVRIAGGGIKPADVELMFDGKHYPENPTLDTPVVRLAKPGDASVVIPVFKTLDAATPLDPPPAKSDGKP